MKNYIFSVIAAACVLEIVCEFVPFSSKSTLKKYVKYIFALSLGLCIIVPLTGFLGINTGGIKAYKADDGTVINEPPGLVYYEDESIVCSCTSDGSPDYNSAANTDFFINECCFGIIRNAKSALCNKFSIDDGRIRLGIAFDASNTSNIKIICAYIHIDDSEKYLESDCIDYLKSQLECEVYKIKRESGTQE